MPAIEEVMAEVGVQGAYVEGKKAKLNLLVARKDVKYRRLTGHEEEIITDYFEMMARRYKEISPKLADLWLRALETRVPFLAAAILKGYVAGAGDFSGDRLDDSTSDLKGRHVLPQDFGYAGGTNIEEGTGAAYKTFTAGTKETLFPVDNTKYYLPSTTAGKRCVILLIGIYTVDKKPMGNQFHFEAPEVPYDPFVEPPTVVESIEEDRLIYTMLTERYIILVPEGSGSRLWVMPFVSDTRPWHFMGVAFFEREYSKELAWSSLI
mgnify:CR=1 FL=1